MADEGILRNLQEFLGDIDTDNVCLGVLGCLVERQCTDACERAEFKDYLSSQ